MHGSLPSVSIKSHTIYFKSQRANIFHIHKLILHHILLIQLRKMLSLFNYNVLEKIHMVNEGVNN
jgi:hypothetical protein